MATDNQSESLTHITKKTGRVLPAWINAQWLRSFRARLLAWYRRDGRDLPWRGTRDPYQVLVSEIMLQQTQISTVIPYYHRFLNRFPDIATLATATETEVLGYWEGLGYYRRAKALHRAAKEIMLSHAGKFPEDFDQLLSLPGIGRYTAGAVASFAFDQARPIVEANTQRLYARLIQLEGSITSASSQQQLWEFATAILPRKHPGVINHAVMDLGSLICKPNAPSCLICPLNDLCPTYKYNLQDQIPQPKAKKKFVDHFEIAVAIRDHRGRLLIWQRPEGSWWAGLWDLPRTACGDFTDQGKSNFESWFENQFDDKCTLEAPLELFKHTVTHHKISCQLFLGSFVPKRRKTQKNFNKGELELVDDRSGRVAESKLWTDRQKLPSPYNTKWVETSELNDLPFSSSGRKMLQWLLKKSHFFQT